MSTEWHLCVFQHSSFSISLVFPYLLGNYEALSRKLLTKAWGKKRLFLLLACSCFFNLNWIIFSSQYKTQNTSYLWSCLFCFVFYMKTKWLIRAVSGEWPQMTLAGLGSDWPSATPRRARGSQQHTKGHQGARIFFSISSWNGFHQLH